MTYVSSSFSVLPGAASGQKRPEEEHLGPTCSSEQTAEPSLHETHASCCREPSLGVVCYAPFAGRADRYRVSPPLQSVCCWRAGPPTSLPCKGRDHMPTDLTLGGLLSRGPDDQDAPLGVAPRTLNKGIMS